MEYITQRVRSFPVFRQRERDRALRETQNLRHRSEDRKWSGIHALVRIPDDRCWHPLSN